jgi:hypothetical protein
MSITIEQHVALMFKGHPENLRKIKLNLSHPGNSVPVKEIADQYIVPILADIEKNCGQEMDPYYVGYMIQYSLMNPNKLMAEPQPEKDVGALEAQLNHQSLDTLIKCDTYKEFFEKNFPAVMPDMIKAAEFAGLTFTKGFEAVDRDGIHIPCPDLCGDDEGNVIKERVTDWVNSVLRMMTAMWEATQKAVATNGPCQSFAEDPAVCDDVGEPKGQCECGYKEGEHQQPQA